MVFKRTSTYVVGIVASVFFFERGFDVAADAIFENHNKGVSDSRHNLSCCVSYITNIAIFLIQKLWKDIQHKYE